MNKIYSYILIFLFPIFGNSQSFEFTKYSEKDGLKNRFVYTIDQDASGYLMIGTGEGLFRYDGFSFREYTTTNGLMTNFITCSNLDEQGVIWYGHDNGSLSKYHGGKIDTINLSQFTHSRINQVSGNHENLWVLSQNDGLIHKDKNNQWKQYKDGIEDYTLYSFYIDRWNRIWLGTDIGLLLATIEGDRIEFNFIDEISESKVSCILKDENNLIIGTEDIGLFTVNISHDQYSIQPLIFDELILSDYNTNGLFLSEAHDLWISTNNKGLIQLANFVDGQYRKKVEHFGPDGLNAQSIRTCTSDREGNIWVGTIGDGLSKIEDSYLTIFKPAKEDVSNVLCVFERNDTIWSGLNGVINISYGNPNNLIGTIDKTQGLPDDEITSLSKDESGTLWIGTAANGLYKMPVGAAKASVLKLPEGVSLLRVNDVLLQNNITYIATNYGVYQFLNDKLISHITIQSGLSSNGVKALYRDMKGRIWLATSTSQITYIEGGEIKNLQTGFDEALTQVRCITEDNSGNVWIGTDGLGIVKVSGDSIVVLNKNLGLYSDYCYSIICDQRNNLWVGHHGAISKVNLINYRIEVFDPSGLLNTDFMDNAAFKTIGGSILFGTSDGIVKYDPENDIKNEIEPILQFEDILINDSLSAFDQEIKLGYGKYNIHFNFIGISLKNATGVKYQYYLEGYDNDWSAITINSNAHYNKLGPGKYVFRVKCYNSDGYGGYTVISIPVFIDKPFWEKWWFIGGCLAIVIVLVRYLIRRRERLLIENQKRLQKALDERTKEVVEQKELLEIKNKDITDSILYAKNIQQAMLPAEGQLSKYFTDAFVYFKPRDIVSGDFFWVEQYDKTVVVSCADCTGHGVPGAFMSLIGTTLLKDVAGYTHVQSSSDVLTYLDSALKEMLHGQGDSVSIQDGMDITVMDYNTETGLLRVASANRPVFLFHKGEFIEIRGDRQSIGGNVSGEKKEFTLHEYYAQKGDTIYLFSDGITDQFGGKEGKKLKRSGFKKWLQEIIHRNMYEQQLVIHNSFEQWKSENPQIDDVIVLGIRF